MITLGMDLVVVGTALAGAGIGSTGHTLRARRAIRKRQARYAGRTVMPDWRFEEIKDAVMDQHRVYSAEEWRNIAGDLTLELDRVRGIHAVGVDAG